ncbi:MAG: hypothetical protein LBK99_02335 [Opitutaceae bacterium]|jgi:predicted outer membrane repeat protein|nr:hypothetical protein [Opitutaceae bacterium]
MKTHDITTTTTARRLLPTLAHAATSLAFAITFTLASALTSTPALTAATPTPNVSNPQPRNGAPVYIGGGQTVDINDLIHPADPNTTSPWNNIASSINFTGAFANDMIVVENVSASSYSPPATFTLVSPPDAILLIPRNTGIVFDGANTTYPDGTVLLDTFNRFAQTATDTPIAGSFQLASGSSLTFENTNNTVIESNSATGAQGGAFFVGGVGGSMLNIFKEWGGLHLISGAAGSQNTSLHFLNNTIREIDNRSNYGTTSGGGAIAVGSSALSIANIAEVNFTGNTATTNVSLPHGYWIATPVSHGGAVTLHNGTGAWLDFKNISTLTFADNSSTATVSMPSDRITYTDDWIEADARGGALSGSIYSQATFSGIGSLVFENNYATAEVQQITVTSNSIKCWDASAEGGALSGGFNALGITGSRNTSFDEIDELIFRQNSATATTHGVLRMADREGFTAFAKGGAISETALRIGSVKKLIVTNNLAEAHIARGGAVYTNALNITAGDVLFDANEARVNDNVPADSLSEGLAQGGALYLTPPGNVTSTHNQFYTTGDITFTNNKAIGTADAQGGAIYLHSPHFQERSLDPNPKSNDLTISIDSRKTLLASGNIVGTGSGTRANFVHLDGVNALSIQANYAGSSADLRDPITGNAGRDPINNFPYASSNCYGQSTVTLGGAGKIKLGGESKFIANSARDGTTVRIGTANADTGILYLYRENEIANPNAFDAAAKVKAGKITIEEHADGTSTEGDARNLRNRFVLLGNGTTRGGTLVAGGGNIITAPEIKFTKGSHLGFDFHGENPAPGAPALLKLNAKKLVLEADHNGADESTSSATFEGLRIGEGFTSKDGSGTDQQRSAIRLYNAGALQLGRTYNLVDISGIPGATVTTTATVIAADDSDAGKNIAFELTGTPDGKTLQLRVIPYTPPPSPPSLPTLTLSASSWTVAATGGTLDVTVTTDQASNWTFKKSGEGDTAWLTVTRNGDTLTLVAAANITGNSRETPVIVSASNADGETSDTLHIAQLAGSPPPPTAAPVITAHPQPPPQTVWQGDPVTFTVTAASQTPLTYQ